MILKITWQNDACDPKKIFPGQGGEWGFNSGVKKVGRDFEDQDQVLNTCSNRLEWKVRPGGSKQSLEGQWCFFIFFYFIVNNNIRDIGGKEENQNSVI